VGEREREKGKFCKGCGGGWAVSHEGWGRQKRTIVSVNLTPDAKYIAIINSRREVETWLL
jgi:hypothetical protein